MSRERRVQKKMKYAKQEGPSNVKYDLDWTSFVLLSVVLPFFYTMHIFDKTENTFAFVWQFKTYNCLWLLIIQLPISMNIKVQNFEGLFFLRRGEWSKQGKACEENKILNV